jgi:hypothetical protein
MPLKVIKSRAVRVTANGKICSRNPKKPKRNVKTRPKKRVRVARPFIGPTGKVWHSGKRKKNAQRKPKRITKAKKRSTKRKVAKR